MFYVMWCSLAKILRFFMIIGAYACAGMIFTEVFFRYVLNLPIFGINEIVLLVGIWLYFIASVYGAFEKTHIQVSIMHLLFKGRPLALSRTIASAITTFLSFMMIQWSFSYIAWSIKLHGITPALRIPIILYQMSILVGAILMSFYFLTELIDNILTVFNKEAFFANLSIKCGYIDAHSD